ncbi:MAG: serpin family protein [Lachnospiraceae bacterium]|nr:serpin family protein [Lachnospiraceae bacterium]
MKKLVFTRFIGVLLCIVMVFNLAACGKTQNGGDPSPSRAEEPSPTKTEDPAPTKGAKEPVAIVSKDLMEGIEASEPLYFGEPSAASLKSAIAFGTTLFEKCTETGNNTLVSPLSVIVALGMTANGANGVTLEEMEKVFGLKREELNKVLGALITALAKDEGNSLKLANAIWFKDETDFVPKADFLQKNADVFKASIYKAPFDETTLADINNWVEQKTAGMIKDILDEIPKLAVMYLVNALAFEAKWYSGYREGAVHEGDFTNFDGSKSKADFMYSREPIYIKTGIASGFEKYYDGTRYSFIALLPDNGHTTDEVIASLKDVMSDFDTYRSYKEVDAVLPKFSADYSVELSKALIAMGMRHAFMDDGGADFTDLGTCPESKLGIHISRVIHKTHIEVDTNGTKAGAATVVEMVKNTAVHEPERIPEVRLDRPFFYLLYDHETKMPFFIGVQNTMK